MAQAVQLAGAMLILAAFVLAQFGRLDTAAWGYLVPNLVGSAILTGSAWTGQNWGFVLLEGIWAMVSGWAVLRKLRSRGTQPRSP